MSERACSKCAFHVNAKTIDDAPPACWNCYTYPGHPNFTPTADAEAVAPILQQLIQDAKDAGSITYANSPVPDDWPFPPNTWPRPPRKRLEGMGPVTVLIPTPGTSAASVPPVDDSRPSSAPELLQRAKELMESRGKEYDQPQGERSMGRAVAAFNAITGRDLSEPEGWLLLQVLKDVRLFTRPGYHRDSAEDGIAYSALKAEAKAAEVEAK